MEDKAPKNGNAAVLHALFSDLWDFSVKEFCVAAGARNAPIIARLLEKERGQGFYKVWHFFDERSAAFFAVGRMMASGTSHGAAVVTTSGTAAAEVLPAMMEAYYQNLPLVAITADRPPRYRHSGAPQAVEQDGIFGPYAAVRWEGKWLPDTRADENCLGQAMATTVHCNVCLEEGFDDGGEQSVSALRDSNFSVVWKARREKIVRNSNASTAGTFWKTPGPLVVLVGGSSKEVTDVRSFLVHLGAPVVAEATSNLLDDEQAQGLLIAGGEKALQSMDIKRVLRIGAVPSWRWWRDLEDREDIHVLNIDSGFRGLARTVNVHMTSLSAPDKTEPKEQELAILEGRGASIMRHLDELLEKFPHSEPTWVRHLSRLVPAGATVFLGNSLPIREWNLAAVKPKPGTRFFANRGANGIDGLLSTGFGVGAEAEEAWIVVGDLSALYDMNAPWILPQLKNQRWRIVVINNGGGKIFSRVKWLRDLPEEAQRIVENRHSLNFEHWAKQWNLEYRRFEDAATLRDDDASAVVWEIVPDEGQTEAFWTEWK